MKRAFIGLFLAFVVLYGQQAYEVWVDYYYLSWESKPLCLLSDIAEQVVAIPLSSADGQAIEQVRDIRQEGDNLFLVSDDVLYRFDSTGAFLCRITDPAILRVACYVVDPQKKQLIVLGNADELHYYTYTGELSESKQLHSDPHRRMQAIAMHQGFIWTAEENLQIDTDTQQSYMEKQLVKYDTAFRPIETHPLVAADLPGKSHFPFYAHLEIGLSEDTGKIYAYSPPALPDDLLRDSLQLLHRQMSGDNLFEQEQAGNLFPMRCGQRFWIASYKGADPSRHYAFCFDSDTTQSWLVAEGFKDNIYHTGSISELQALDINSQTYYFCQSGESLKQSFPQRSSSEGSVVFIVTLF